MKKYILTGFGLFTGSQCFAAAQDWSSIGTAVSDEISAVLPVALPIMGTVVAVLIGKRVLKAVAKG